MLIKQPHMESTKASGKRSHGKQIRLFEFLNEVTLGIGNVFPTISLLGKYTILSINKGCKSVYVKDRTTNRSATTGTQPSFLSPINKLVKSKKIWLLRKLPKATTNVQKNKSYVGLFISYVGVFISYVGLIKSYVGLYNSYVGDKIS